MTDEGDIDQSTVIRNILESMASGEVISRGVSTDSMAQLLAAALTQAGQSILNLQGATSARQDGTVLQHQRGSEGFDINSFNTEKNDEKEHLDDSLAPEGFNKPRMMSVKLPIELRRRIIAMRKEGKKCREIAKELKVSGSGVRKVWERFLATGMVHDRKPNSGRPRKYPAPSSFELQYTSDNILQADNSSPHIEYVISDSTESGQSDPTAPTLSGDNSVFVEGPLDMPGATVEIVETDPSPGLATQRKRTRYQPPVYREQFLLKLIEGCPLAVVREDETKANSPHILNLNSITKKPLYMESVLGYPFGAIPTSKPFVSDVEQAKVILSDPINPLGKELLASLGYSTKIFFNMCCKPSPLFEPDKIISNLPFSIGPGTISETAQSVLQLLVNLCKDPVAALALVPNGSGPCITATSSEGVVSSIQFSELKKLSSYWSTLLQFASDLGCCENFLSAMEPSAPCLLCHPYQNLVKQMEIREPCGDEIWSPALRANHHSEQLTPSQLSSSVVEIDNDSNLTPDTHKMSGRKRGRPKKSNSENHLIIDGHFEIPTSIESSSQVGTSPLPAVDMVTIPSATDVIGVVLSPSQLKESNTTTSGAEHQTPVTDNCSQSCMETIMDTRGIERTQTSLANHSETAATPQSHQQDNSPTLRRSLRKRRPKTSSLLSTCTEVKTQKQNNASTESDTLKLHKKRGRKSNFVSEVGSVTKQKQSDPMNWSVEDVVEFVTDIPRCNYASAFREHEVDGESLLSLDAEMMVKLMGIKAGPALKIHRKIKELKGNISVM